MPHRLFTLCLCALLLSAMTLTGCKFIVTVLLRDGQEELEAQDFVSF